MASEKSGLTKRDPFSLLRHMQSEFDRFFDTPSRWPVLPARLADGKTWFPEIDVFQKDNRLITKIDLPGLKKEDVKVEVTDGHLSISGERRTEAEEKKEDFYRCEREYGSFSRMVPLPDGVKPEDIKATFADGVLEVSVPLPATVGPKTHKVAIEDGSTAAKAAA